MAINTHNLVCDFGRHRGTLWTRMPISYLRWLCNAVPERAAIAKAELERRGTTTPDMEITGHAIDRASQCLLERWQESQFISSNPVGLHAWLLQVAQESRKHGVIDDQGRVHHRGVILVFADDTSEWPVLKTVMKE